MQYNLSVFFVDAVILLRSAFLIFHRCRVPESLKIRTSKKENFLQIHIDKSIELRYSCYIEIRYIGTRCKRCVWTVK